MKSYKELKENLRESFEVPNRGLPQMVDGGVNMFAIEDKQVLDKMNAALAHLNSSPTSDPNSRIVDIKKTISHAGLDFDHSLFEADEENPIIEIPVTQMGGRIGMTPEEGWVDDDGISHRTGGVRYGIRLESSKGQGGLWSIDAKVVPLGLDEAFELVNEVLGAGGGFGQQQEPNFFQQAPKSSRPDWSFPSRRGPANQTRGLHRSVDGSSWTSLDGLPVTEEWQNLWDKWINNGGVGEMPWPPQFQGMFENDNVFDFDLNDPQSGWYYYNSIFNWLFGTNPMYWGDGALAQMAEAGVIELPDLGHQSWDDFYMFMSGSGPYGGPPELNVQYIMAMFGDPNSQDYQNMNWDILQGWINTPYGSIITYIWSILAGVLPDLIAEPWE